MFHLTLANLISIQFLLCSTIILFQQGEGQFTLHTEEGSDQISLRLWYKNYKYRVISIKYWHHDNSNDPKIRELEMKEEDIYVINNLEPCTIYTISAKLRNRDKRVFEQTTKQQTKTAQPICEISNVVPSSNFVNVSFKCVNYNCIDSMKILLNSSEVASFKKPNLPDNFLIDELAPCASYNISVKTNSYAYSDTKLFTTNSVEEIPIEDLEFDNETGLLTWKRPDFVRECIKHYDIYIASDLGRITASSVSESYDLTGQPGCYNFKIHITPQGINGKALGRSKPIVIRTGFQKPGSIENLVGVNSSSNSITINWYSPYLNPDCVKNYIIFNGQSEYTTSTTYTLHHLEPCKYYNIQVCINTVTDEVGLCNQIQLSTTYGTPGKVEELQHSGYDTLRFNWKPPNYGASCIEKYEINVNEKTGTHVYNTALSSQAFEIDASKLKSCQTYIVSVTPVTSNGMAGPSEFKTFTTQSAKPSPPTAPLLISKTATLLELKSEYNAEKDYCPLREAMFKCQEKDTNTVHWENMTLTETERRFTGNVSDLKDFTAYKCTAYVKNDNDDLSDASEQGIFETDEKLSDPPEITIGVIKFDSFTFSWVNLNSRIKLLNRYHVTLTTVFKQYQMPDGCEDTRNKSYILIDSNLLKYEITNLKPRTKYTIEMAIENTVGIGDYSKPVEVITEPHIPHQVTNFHISKVNVNQTVDLKWNIPCEINGELVSVTGKLYENLPVEKTIDWKLAMVDGILPKTYTINYVLKSECFYNITVGIELQNFTGSMNLTSISFTTPAVPEAYNSSDWGELVHETSPINNITLTISKNLLSSTKGKILRFTFLIAEQYCADNPKPSQMYFITGNDYVNLPTWYDVQDEQCTKQYQLDEYMNNYNFDEVDSFQIIIGNESCEIMKDNNESSQFCNGPLKFGTTYSVVARVFTSNGYADTLPIWFGTEKTFFVIFLMPLLILVLILLLVFFITFGAIKLKPRCVRKERSETEIPVKSFVAHYLNINAEVLGKEYRSITTLNLNEFTTAAAVTNKAYNRYENIRPYDYNRIVLPQNMYYNADYINASFIDGYKRKKQFIVTQAPTEQSFYNFWNMVIATGSHKIVMLTEIIENSNTKCHEYFSVANVLEINDITVTVIKEINTGKVTRREIKITKGTAKRLIVQYHFRNWPQYGCPSNGLDLIKFIREITSENVSKYPIVVHSIAGVGRTGILIALDILIQQIKYNKYLNIYETVKKLRYQRDKMIQTFEQYEFLYETSGQYIQWKWPKGIQ